MANCLTKLHEKCVYARIDSSSLWSLTSNVNPMCLWPPCLSNSVSVFSTLGQKLNFIYVSPNTKYLLVVELPDLEDQLETVLSLIYSFQRVDNSFPITHGALFLLSHAHAHRETFLWCLRLLGFISKSIHLVKHALIACTVSINLLLSSDNCRTWWLHQPSSSPADGKVPAPLF